MYHKDTITAIATPYGLGGIGIIRISGPESLRIVSEFFRSETFNPSIVKSHHLYYGYIFDPSDTMKIDDVLISYMKAPSSYTGESVVEINCHSGFMVLQKILDLVIKAGARMADAGEFTKRAFLNGRIDLTQAEAVIDVINSKTDFSLKLASRQLNGGLANKINEIRIELVEILSFIEVSIDFPEDDITPFPQQTTAHKVMSAASKISHLIATYEEGYLYTNGIQAVIAGKPNVGKSSILNALLGDYRAIVTPLPGTTRDVIQETINIRGIPVRLLDTAGLRNSDHEIEKIGIDMTISKISEADLVLLIVDGSTPLDDFDLSTIALLKHKKTILVINKSDLPQVVSIPDISCSSVVSVSALHHDGIDILKDAIACAILKNTDNILSDTFITNMRHKNALEKAHESLMHVYSGFEKGLSPELIAVDLQTSLSFLGEITGETATEDILDAVFSNFCIGK